MPDSRYGVATYGTAQFGGPVAGESIQAHLANLTGVTGLDSAEGTYASWAGLATAIHNGLVEPYSLEALVRYKLVQGGKTTQIRESLLGTVRAGGAVGESVEEALAKTGLVGWS